MRIALGNVLDVRDEGGRYRFDTGPVKLDVVPVTDRIILFEYTAEGYTVPCNLEKASENLFIHQKQDIISGVHKTVTGWEVNVGSTSVHVTADTALVSVLYKGMPVHGGRAGDKDTVIPQCQFRLCGEEGAGTGSFAFALDRADAFYGLGDKAGSPDHRGKRVRMYNKDALGYDASFSDPLYKSIPFIIRSNRRTGVCAGLYFPESCISAFDLGKESPFYWSVDIKGGPFRYFLILGDDYTGILNGYCTLTGFPALPPLYSFGYLGSSMNYAEARDARQRIERFFSDVESHGLPCEGMYVSSGYLKSDEGYRHAFMWNRRKFPDPNSFLKGLLKRGYHLSFNIKPGILKTHPWYGELEEKGYFIKDNAGNSVVEYFWGGDASFIDFANPDAVAWWKRKLCESYLDYGVEGIWNDNNEFEMDDPEMDAYGIRTVYPVLMSKASYDVCMERNPGKRPWIYTRSGYAGMQRYARTWTGDNSSDFRTLKYNQFQGASLGLSGVPFTGHDLGGFYGPEPSPELLVRCCQSAIFQGRFVIHSWREDDEPTEPWKFTQVFGIIRDALWDHYRHMPYIYNEAWHSSVTGAPLERLLCLEYPADPALSPDMEQFMFGRSVMKAPVLNEGQTNVHVVFPAGSIWYSPALKKSFRGGTDTVLDTPLDRTWYFYKAGSIVPRSCEVTRLTSGFFRNLEFIVLPCDGTFMFDYHEDDGESVGTQDNHNIWTFTVTYSSRTGSGSMSVACTHRGSKTPLEDRNVRITLPEGFEGGKSVALDELDGLAIAFSGHYD